MGMADVRRLALKFFKAFDRRPTALKVGRPVRKPAPPSRLGAFFQRGKTHSKHAKRHGASAARRKCGVTPPGGFADQKLSIKRGPHKIVDFVGNGFAATALLRRAASAA